MTDDNLETQTKLRFARDTGDVSFPSDGGTAIWFVDGESAPVVESCSQVALMMERAIANNTPWCAFTLLADANDEHDARKPCFVRPQYVTGMTYMSPAECERFESEIS